MISEVRRDIGLQRIYVAKSLLAQRRDRLAAAEMARAERLPVETLMELQRARARALLRHAFTTVPHYRKAYTVAGVGAGDLDRDETWAALPQLTKSDLAHHPERLVSPALQRRGLRSTTGGSTGRPLQVLHDSQAPIAALWWRAYRWWGVGPGVHEGFVNRQHHSGLRALVHDLQWWPSRRLYLNAQGMGPTEMDAFITRWNQLRPAVLTGYVQGIYQLAEHVARSGQDVAAPQAVAVTASVLHPSQRLTIQNTFAAPVHDCYRSAEVPWIAAQCGASSGLHVMADHRIVEIVDDAGAPVAPGVLGHVLVTDLSNPVMPLLRYRIGDRARAIAEPCPCGRTLPLMAPVDGREVDVLRGPHGHVVTGGLSALFNDWPGAVVHFQIEQAADWSTTLRYVPGGDAERAHGAATAAARAIESMLHGTVTVRTESVDVLPHQGGKIRLVISRAHSCSPRRGERVGLGEGTTGEGRDAGTGHAGRGP